MVVVEIENLDDASASNAAIVNRDRAHARVRSDELEPERWPSGGDPLALVGVVGEDALQIAAVPGGDPVGGELAGERVVDDRGHVATLVEVDTMKRQSLFVYASARMTRFPIAFTLAGLTLTLTLASVALVGCKLPKRGPPEEPPTELSARRPSPASKSEDFAVDEDVSSIDDDETFAIDGRVVSVTAAPKGYTVRMGTGRAAKTKAFPASRVFPAPWASAKRVRVGDSIYQVRQFGEFTPPKCVVEVVPADIHAQLIAKCDETGTRVVARTEAFFAI
jgi:hypothetical protein